MRAFAALLLATALCAPALAQQVPNPQPRDRVADNTELAAAKLSAFPAGVYRDDYAANFGAPPLFFTPSDAACPVPGGDGGSQVPSVDGKCWRAVFPNNEVDVRWFGADPTGVADARPKINAAFALGSGHTFILPKGTYVLKSQSASPYPLVAGPVGLILAGTAAAHLSNVKIKGHNAVITADNSTNNMNWLALDFVDHLEVDGLTFQANKTGFTGVIYPTVMIAWHLSDFSIRNMRLSGDWGGSTYNPSFMRGDWWVRGEIDNVQLPAVGQCIDGAFWQSVSISNMHAVGAGSAGGAAAFPCISIANDTAMATAYPPAAPYNFSTTRDVAIASSDISNFAQAVALRAGQRYRITGNSLHNNPGHASGWFPYGAGVIFPYSADPCCTSAADPAAKVTLTGNVFSDNGAAVGGGGIFFDTTASTGVAFSDFNITGNGFYNNTSAGVTATTSANLTNVYLGANSFSGVLQTTPVGLPIVQAGTPPLSWVPLDDSGAGLAFSGVSARYELNNTLVHIFFSLTFPSTANSANAVIKGLPFPVVNAPYGYASTVCAVTAGGLAAPLVARTLQNTSRVAFYNAVTGANYTNANLTALSLQCQITYPAL